MQNRSREVVEGEGDPGFSVHVMARLQGMRHLVLRVVSDVEKCRTRRHGFVLSRRRAGDRVSETVESGSLQTFAPASEMAAISTQLGFVLVRRREARFSRTITLNRLDLVLNQSFSCGGGHDYSDRPGRLRQRGAESSGTGPSSTMAVELAAKSSVSTPTPISAQLRRTESSSRKRAR